MLLIFSILASTGFAISFHVLFILLACAQIKRELSKKERNKKKAQAKDVKHARTAGGGNERLMSQEAAESKGQ
jgi:predicted membrane protein